MSITLGAPGVSLVTASDLALTLFPQALAEETVMVPPVKEEVKVTSTMVSFTPAPPGCAVMLELAGTFHTYEVAFATLRMV